MPQWHGNLRKRKKTGGKRHPHRGKRAYEMGSDAVETKLGRPSKRIDRVRGANIKNRLLSAKYANVTDPSAKKTKRVEILRVVKNPANVDYNRRGVITRGAVIETSLGEARVTSKPGQDGVVNAILISKAKA